MANLVIAEHDGAELKGATRAVLSAAAAIGGETDVLVAGSGCDDVVQAAAQLPGVRRLIVADAQHYDHCLAENVSALVVALAGDYSHILASASTDGKNFMPRVAVMLDVMQISDISAVIDAETFERPIYAGNCMATVKSSDATKVITVRASSFDGVAGEGRPERVDAPAVDGAGLSEWVEDILSESERPELSAADVVISGGRGMQNGDNFKLLEGIADKLGAAIGASRAAVDAGFVPNDMQVGQTGKVVAPQLYIAVGISGAIQHLAGMKDSKVIVAINKDADAPIFQVADYGLVADLFQVLPEFEQSL
ncbi:MAG: electron transfer flavoprotein subunit alpha/FixB family protein [Gammaproteobacteria bacterium AqS3]|nr:electron transfer flavoprotein subunit alpha/FixB family protein [Gammaproteobacteria bacterium AqS3]